MIAEFSGWIGGILLAFCGVPQAIQSWRDGHSNGLNWAFISLWGIGEGLTLIYVIPKIDWPLILNYSSNLVTLAIIVWFKVCPRVYRESSLVEAIWNPE